jgi:hypothetical protein
MFVSSEFVPLGLFARPRLSLLLRVPQRLSQLVRSLRRTAHQYMPIVLGENTGLTLMSGPVTHQAPQCNMVFFAAG